MRFKWMIPIFFIVSSLIWILNQKNRQGCKLKWHHELRCLPHRLRADMRRGFWLESFVSFPSAFLYLIALLKYLKKKKINLNFFNQLLQWKELARFDNAIMTVISLNEKSWKIVQNKSWNDWLPFIYSFIIPYRETNLFRLGFRSSHWIVSMLEFWMKTILFYSPWTPVIT